MVHEAGESSTTLLVLETPQVVSSRSAALAAIFSAVRSDEREGAVLSRCAHLQGDPVQTGCEVRHGDAAGEGRSLCERHAPHDLLEKPAVRKDS